MARQMSIPSRSDLLNRQEQSIAHGSLTNSKRPECFVKGVYPTHFVKQQGCYSWDNKGNKYIDFLSALGTSILGFNNEEINQAIVEQLKRGTTFSLASDLEAKAAEKVKECFPWVEKVRFLKTGSEACSAAIRICRTKTNYASVYSEGYHGWADLFTCLTDPHLGVPPDGNIIKGSYAPAGTAAVIIEPVITDPSPTRIQELIRIRKRCDETNVPLIFDEIITGFRYSKYGVCNSSGVVPDIICLGKAIANGMPLSVVAGKTSIMECDNYFVSSTFAGETLSLAAAIKTMSLLQTKFNLDHLWGKGLEFQYKFNDEGSGIIRLVGYPTRFSLEGDVLSRALFCQEAIKAGIFFHPSTVFFNFSHIPVMDTVLSAVKSIMGRIKTGSVSLEGELPKISIAQKARS